MKVLILGADGFIGRHIAFHFRSIGIPVLACARDPRRLAAMGFDTLKADLTDPKTHDPAFWQPHLAGGTHLINAAGLLTGTPQAFEDVHVSAPRAAMAALSPGAQCVLISAVGIEAATPFAHWRRQGEAIAAKAIILRPGLVLADTSYGGSSLLRALAALPLVTPLIGTGQQPFNPLHATDLATVIADCLTHPPGIGVWEIGGPETVTQDKMIFILRQWLGLGSSRKTWIPLGVAKALGRIGDVLKFGPISATAVSQLESGVLANAAPLLAKIPSRPRPVSAFAMARPAGTQDLWQARLYLIKPLIRLTLAIMWLASAALGLFLPPADFLPFFGPGMPDSVLILLARFGGLVDLALGLALLRNWQPKPMAIAQLMMVGGYTLGLTALAPQLWLDPFGSLLKNLPILMLILTHFALIEER